jgi:acyl carrier protein
VITTEGHAVGANDSLEAAGVDSMALPRVLLFVEAQFGFWIPDEDLAPDTVRSVTSPARYVARALAA